MKLQVVKETGIEVSRPADVVESLVEDFWTEKREMVGVILLDTRCGIIDGEVVSIGGLNLSVMEARTIYRLAIARAADSIIVVHNHPSGDPAPSDGDVEVTRKVAEAGRIIGIELRDHIVVGLGYDGTRRSLSMREKMLI